MGYLLLAFGLFIGARVLYRFLLTASVQEIKALGLVLLVFVIGLGVFAMAITGRLPAALALVVALIPVLANLLKIRKALKETATELKTASAVMSRKDALDVLGLTEGATSADIQEAYKKLMLKVHPDNQGSGWMASQLNQARDILLGKEE